jgi:hypothetical protein
MHLLHQRFLGVRDQTARFRFFSTRVGDRYRKRVLVNIQTYVCALLIHDRSSLIVAVPFDCFSEKHKPRLKAGQVNT